MVKDWDKVQAQVYKYYVEDKMPLTRVMKKMLKEHHFEASERTFRKKLRDWKFKRDSTPNDYNAGTVPASRDHSSQFAPAIPTNINQIDHGSLDHQLWANSDMSFFDVGNSPLHDFGSSSWNNAPISPFRDSMFEKILQEVCEAPADRPSKDILPHDGFYNKTSSTLLHYVAARGFMSEVLIHVLHFCSHHGHAVDHKDFWGDTALHIAVLHDRVENIAPLYKAGARVDMGNRLGELPIHVAVMRSKNPQLLEALFARHENGVKALVDSPSPRAGQVALDLAVERVLFDLSQSGKEDCTQATRSILLEVLKRGETLGNTTYLRAHAEKDQKLFKRAMDVVSGVWLGKKLRRIMIDVLSAVNKPDRG